MGADFEASSSWLQGLEEKRNDQCYWAVSPGRTIMTCPERCAHWCPVWGRSSQSPNIFCLDLRPNFQDEAHMWHYDWGLESVQDVDPRHKLSTFILPSIHSTKQIPNDLLLNHILMHLQPALRKAFCSRWQLTQRPTTAPHGDSRKLWSAQP